MIALKPGDTVWVEPLGPGKNVWENAKVVDIYGRNSLIIEIDWRRYHRSRVYLREAIGDLEKVDCNMYMNEIIPFSHEEAGEATSEEKDRGSNIARSCSAETMIKDGIIVEEEETMANATKSSDTDTSYAVERNPEKKEAAEFSVSTL